MEVGIKETKEVAILIGKAVAAGKKALEDGTFDGVKDAMHFGPVLMALLPALNDAGKVGEEVKDLSVAEVLELVEVGVKEADLPSKHVSIVKQLCVLAVESVKLYHLIKE